MSGRDTLRWSGSLAVVLGAHVGAVAGMLAWNANSAPPAPPPAAVVMELAPLVQAPEPPPEPPPEEVPPEPEPPPPEPPPEPEPPPPPPEPVVEEPPPVVEPAVPLPPKKVERKPPPPPKPVAAKPPPQEAPPPVQAPPAQQAAAPRVDKAVVSRSNAVPTWQGVLLAHLERHKRYPRAAQARRQEGVVKVAFTLDRTGNVLSASVRGSSGHRLLDSEAMEMLQRAAPLPPPPPEVEGDSIELVVPVQFFMK